MTLRGLTVKSSGIYRCEVSAEAPSFDSVQAEGRMTIVRKLNRNLFCPSRFKVIVECGQDQVLHNKRRTRPCQLTANMYLLTMRYLSWNGLDPEFVKERTCLIIFKSVICSSTLPHYYMPSNNVYQTVCLSFCLLIAMTPLNLFTPWSCTVAGPLHFRRYDRKEAAEL